MSMHEFENGRIVFFTDDFLESEDVTGYLNRNDNFPAVLKIKGKYYSQPRVDEKLHQVQEDRVRRYAEDVPLELYSYWQERSPGERTGLAAICFRNIWYLAVRVDDRYVGRNDHGNRCDYVDFCRLAKIKNMCDKSMFDGCKFLYSNMTDAPAWPPKGARLWCLFPAERVLDDDAKELAAKELFKLPCKVNPTTCELFAYFDQNLRGE